MPKKISPISPSEASLKKQEAIPDEVIEAFNELIAKNFNGNTAYVKQKEVAALAANKLNTTTGVLYENHWLDVEGIFREAGWHVDYDKPGYNESYDASFKFSKKAPKQ